MAGLARLGFPIAEVTRDGSAVITKVAGSGGRVSAATCKEQLLYEIHDPSRYLTPDVTADFSDVSGHEIGPDRVSVQGATGPPRPDTLKVSVGYRDGFVGEGQISYAGPGAVARRGWRSRSWPSGCGSPASRCRETRYDLIGVDALHGARPRRPRASPTRSAPASSGAPTARDEAARIGREVETLYTNGPAGGGGASRQVREIVAVASTFVPRERVATDGRRTWRRDACSCARSPTPAPETRATRPTSP